MICAALPLQITGNASFATPSAVIPRVLMLYTCELRFHSKLISMSLMTRDRSLMIQTGLAHPRPLSHNHITGMFVDRSSTGRSSLHQVSALCIPSTEQSREPPRRQLVRLNPLLNLDPATSRISNRQLFKSIQTIKSCQDGSSQAI
jgi:hypothetical protein